MSAVLLSTTYFGPIQWYRKLCQGRQVIIEQCESFQKQTYRNRCVIATANGPLALIVPVERSTPSAGQGTTIRDVCISDHGNWRHLHWNAIVSAYGDSPFFEYYQDDLRPFFERRWKYLFDFNEAIRDVLCQLLDISPSVTFTRQYARHYPADGPDAADDCRDTIRPKLPPDDRDARIHPYYQVYARRHGFLPNLSIIDLLFNMGNESIFWLIPQ